MWLLILETEQGVNAIHGIFHDHFQFSIGNPRITRVPRTGWTQAAGMDIFNRPIAKSQGDDCLCFPCQLLAIHRGIHSGLKLRLKKIAQ